MNMRTALVAHSYPVVVDAIATLVADAGYSVTRAGDAATAATALAARPDLAVIAAAFDTTPAGTGPGATRTLVLGDTDAEGVVALTTPVARLAEVIAAAAGGRPTTGSPTLTPRERDVARLVAAGQRNRLIATTLGISEGTVKMHLHNVYAKLGLQSRTQLAMSAGALGAR